MWLALVDAVAADPHLSHFDVARDGAAYRVDASADLDADQALVWGTITDYEKLPEFVPGIRSVRVLETRADGNKQRLTIEQVGEFRFLFFARRIAVLLDVEQQARSRIEARALARPHDGDPDAAGIDQFEGTYTLLPIAGGVRLGYRARFVPDFYLPPIFGAFAVRRTMEAQFQAMLDEIYRRRAAHGPQGTPR